MEDYAEWITDDGFQFMQYAGETVAEAEARARKSWEEFMEALDEMAP